MLFRDITIIDENFKAQEHRWVGVRDGLIDYLGGEAPKNAADYDEAYDGSRKVLMPGLFNIHSHAPMTLLRGWAEEMELQSWLNDKVFPFEAKISDETAAPATRLAIAEMLRFGTVSMTDMYYFTDVRAQIVLESGIKCNLSECVLGMDGTPYEDLPARAFNEHLARDFNEAGEGRLKIDLCAHAEYTTCPALVEGLGQAAVDMGLGTHIHLSETQREHEECKQRHDGMTPIEYFDSLGLFRTPCTAAHCVWTEPGDWEIMRERGVTAATNPASNLKLGSGMAPVPEMLKAGVRVGLGTDGVASNNNHDMFQDLYLLALLHKGRTKDPTAINCEEALRCATVSGALAQRRDDCGLVKEGYRADLVVLDSTSRTSGRPPMR